MDFKFYLSLFLRRLPWFAVLVAIGTAIGLTLASVLDKRSEIPFTPREYPFDSLKKELNGSTGVGPRD